MNKKKSVVFLSNYFNHHQSELSDALWTICDGDFSFVETAAMPVLRKKLGYTVQKRPYAVPYRGNEEQVLHMVRSADVVIAGSAPRCLVRERIHTGKLLFCYSERPLKKGFEWYKYIPRLILWHCRNPFWKPIYLLCASAYTAKDYRKFGLFRNKAYKWGYFPATKRYESISELMVSKNTKEILWCGRFLDWKHPDDAIAVARQLKKDGYDFCLKFIGEGEMADCLKNLVQENHLEDCVQFLGSMNPDQVRTHMEHAGIFLFTSDRREGWGAVLNESMNSGCAVIASTAIGSVPHLIEDQNNGMVYKSGDVQQLTEKVKYLLEHPEKQKDLGLAAYKTIVDTWNAQMAAERVMELADYILDGRQGAVPFTSGPCSIAD